MMLPFAKACMEAICYFTNWLAHKLSTAGAAGLMWVWSNFQVCLAVLECGSHLALQLLLPEWAS